MNNSSILVLAKIREERGVNGRLKIIRRGDMMERLEKNAKIKIFSAAGIKDGFLLEPAFLGEYRLVSLEPLTGETAEARFADVDTREAAAALKGCFIGMELEEARKKYHDPDDPYLFEYLGCDVYEEDQKKGKVIGVEEYNNKQWLIVGADHKEVMIPLQGPFIQNFQARESKINIVAGNGLFEFDETA